MQEQRSTVGPRGLQTPLSGSRSFRMVWRSAGSRKAARRRRRQRLCSRRVARYQPAPGAQQQVSGRCLLDRVPYKQEEDWPGYAQHRRRIILHPQQLPANQAGQQAVQRGALSSAPAAASTTLPCAGGQRCSHAARMGAATTGGKGGGSSSTQAAAAHLNWARRSMSGSSLFGYVARYATAGLSGAGGGQCWGRGPV